MPWSTTFPSQIVIAGEGPQTGLFVYSPTAGPGNLIASITSAGATDPYGNFAFPGSTSYEFSATEGSWLATNIYQGQITFYKAASASGPWTETGSIVSHANGNLGIGTFAALDMGTIPIFGADLAWQAPVMSAGWSNNSTISGDQNLSFRRVASPPGGVSVTGSFSRSGGAWANGSQVCSLPAGYYNPNNSQYVPINWGVTTGTSYGQGGMLKITTAGTVLLYITGSGGGVNGNVFWPNGTYFTQ